MKSKKPEHIICFALPAWEADYLRSTVELMKGLAAENLVLYVDYAYTVADFIKGVLGRKKFEWERLIGIKPRLRRVQGDGNVGLYVLSLPPVFPAFIFKKSKYFEMANKLNAAITGFYINRAARKLNMRNIIGFNSFQPFLGEYWQIKGLTFSVYYIYDDFTNVPRFKKFMAAAESRFLAKTDLVIVSSDELKSRKKNLEVPVEVVNNGVHFDAFFNSIDKNRLNSNYIKTVGYIGTMDNRLDLDLLEYLVSQMPCCRFLFVGKVFEDTIYSRLTQYLNVTFEPPVSPGQVPFIQNQVDVGIIPYVCNALTAAIYPLKINEFLAMGLPVVMTPFASVGEADKVIYIAADQGKFKEYVEDALFESDAALTHRRQEIARKADWKERSEQLMYYIEKHKEENSATHSMAANQLS
jgi:hypothetical protein